jgi:hypothetical protein
MEKYLKPGVAAKIVGWDPMYLTIKARAGKVPAHIVAYGSDGRKRWGFLKSELEVYRDQIQNKKKEVE